MQEADFLRVAFIGCLYLHHFEEIELFWGLMALRLSFRLPQHPLDGLQVGVLGLIQRKKAVAQLGANLQADSKAFLRVEAEIVPAGEPNLIENISQVGEIDADEIGHLLEAVILEVKDLLHMSWLLFLRGVLDHLQPQHLYSFLEEGLQQKWLARLPNAVHVFINFPDHSYSWAVLARFRTALTVAVIQKYAFYSLFTKLKLLESRTPGGQFVQYFRTGMDSEGLVGQFFDGGKGIGMVFAGDVDLESLGAEAKALVQLLRFIDPQHELFIVPVWLVRL